MKLRHEILIADLIERTQDNIARAQLLNSKTDTELNFKVYPESWSVLECLEHLNLYGRFYIPEIDKQIKLSCYPAEAFFKSGWLGNYFANTLLPKEKLTAMKTFKSMDPINSSLNRGVVATFLEQQSKILELLDAARSISLNKTKTAISITKRIKLKLGDTFRVVIYHNQRHIAQAEKVLGNI